MDIYIIDGKAASVVVAEINGGIFNVDSVVSGSVVSGLEGVVISAVC